MLRVKCQCQSPLKFSFDIDPLRLRPEAPNRLRLVPERLERSLLDRYKCRRRQHHINKAAAQLWAQGVEFQRALKIVQEAFDEATYE